MHLKQFLENDAPDHRGRKLSQIWQFTDAEMETCHDYMQWVFPLDQESGAVPNAPAQPLYRMTTQICLNSSKGIVFWTKLCA